jgi:hypothetical protein
LQTLHGSKCRETLHVSAARLKAALSIGCGVLRQYPARLARELSTCRECGRPVKFSWEICEYCGAGKPVKIEISPSVFVTAVCCQVALLLIY